MSSTSNKTDYISVKVAPYALPQVLLALKDLNVAITKIEDDLYLRIKKEDLIHYVYADKKELDENAINEIFAPLMLKTSEINKHN